MLSIDISYDTAGKQIRMEVTNDDKGVPALANLETLAEEFLAARVEIKFDSAAGMIKSYVLCIPTGNFHRAVGDYLLKRFDPEYAATSLQRIGAAVEE